VPRYVWTNVHTSVIFWAPVGSLILIGGWLETSLGLQGVSGKAVAALWWMVIALVALVMHTRTLLAPFFAIHGDLPGTLAALEAWRLSGRYFAICLSTLVIASLPMVLPLLALVAIAVTVAPGTEKAAVVAAAPYAVWAGIQLVRTVLIPALCVLYNDLWTAELRWRRAVGSPPVPRLARALLTLTRPLPSLWGSRRRPA
jgi:uncharacterized membrane protein